MRFRISYFWFLYWFVFSSMFDFFEVQFGCDLSKEVADQKVQDISGRLAHCRQQDNADADVMEITKHQADEALSQASKAAQEEECLAQQTVSHSASRREASEGARRHARLATEARMENSRLMANAAGADDRACAAALQEAKVHRAT